MLSFLFISLPFGCNQGSKVTVRRNPPRALITQPAEGAQLLENYTYEFRGSASSFEFLSEELVAVWRTNDTELCPSTPPQADGLTLCEAKLTLDQEEIFLEVTDPIGEITVVSITVDVIPSGPPEGAILTPTNIGRYYSDVPVQFSAQVQDAEADPEDLELSWSSSLDGTLELSSVASNDGTYLDSTQLTEGNHRIELTITDPQGNIGQDSVEISVGGPNQSPLCEITMPADGDSIESGYSTTFRGTASDPDVPANELSAIWQSNIDGVLSSNVPSAAGEVVADAVLSGGVHTITLAVTDETGATCTDFVLYTVSVPPTITVNSPQINEVFNNENPVFLDATVSDQEDPSSALVVEWSSDADGLLHTQNADSNGTATVNVEGLSLGFHTLTARVTDLSGLTAERVIPIEVADCGQVFWYPDLDQDGYGDPNPLTLFTGCSPPSLHVSQPGDCDDTDPLVYTGATEYFGWR